MLKNDFENNSTKIFKALEVTETILPTPFYWMDKNGVVLGINELCLKEIGATREIVGKKPYDFYKKEIADHILHHNAQVIKREEILSQEEWIEDVKTKQVKCFTSVKAPLYDDQGQVIGIVGSSINITNEKQIENQLLEAKEKAEFANEKEEQLRRSVMIFAGSIAHDLRTPLAAINILTQVLCDELKENSSPKTKELLEQLTITSSEMNDTIELSLKSLTQIVTGIQHGDDLTTCHIWSCIEKTINHYPFNEGERTLIHWDNKNSFSFLGNPVFFYRILFNLIKNSLYQIHKKGKGEIFIESNISDSSHLLSFKDTAGGVTEDLIVNIFAGFNTTKAEGTGIGLAFCQLSMRSIGGDLICRIVDGDCIEFVLKFPKVKG